MILRVVGSRAVTDANLTFTVYEDLAGTGGMRFAMAYLAFYLAGPPAPFRVAQPRPHRAILASNAGAWC